MRMRANDYMLAYADAIRYSLTALLILYGLKKNTSLPDNLKLFYKLCN